MTREQAREAAKVMLHYADGGKIEWCTIDMEDWNTIEIEAGFNWFKYDYRIKRTLPEVGKWYVGANGKKLKCVEHMNGKIFVVFPDNTFAVWADTFDFGHLKEVEP